MDYTFHLTGTFKGGRRGNGKIKTEGLDQTVSIGKEMAGPGLGTNPDELMIGALSSCYLMTLSIGLEKREIPYNQIKIRTIGTVTEEGGLHFKEVTHYPVVYIDPEAKDSELKKIIIEAMYQAEKDCMIAKAVKGNVQMHLEPDVQYT